MATKTSSLYFVTWIYKVPSLHREFLIELSIRLLGMSLLCLHNNLGRSEVKLFCKISLKIHQNANDNRVMQFRKHLNIYIA